MKKPSIISTVTIIIFIWIGTISTNNIFAQVQDAITGYVKSKDGKPIEGADVTLVSTKYGEKLETTTDKEGYWRKYGIRPGIWTVEVRAEGYEGARTNFQVYPRTRSKPVYILLSPRPESLLSKGDALFEESNYVEALEEYQKVLEEHQDLYIAYEKIGHCYHELGDLEKAIEAFKKYLEKQPQSEEALINLSAVYFEKGDLDNGMKYFNQIEEERRKNPDLFFNIGIILFKKGKTDMAMDYFNKCIVLDPNYVDGYYQLALAYLNKGDKEEAKKNLQKVVEIAPDSEKAALAKNILKSLK